MPMNEQVQVGGNEAYVSLCRRHFRSATGDGGGHMSGRPSLPPHTPGAVPDGAVTTSDSDRESPS